MTKHLIRRNDSALLAAIATVAVSALLAPQAHATIMIGNDASNYAILFEGGGNNTLQITNVTTNTAGSGAGQGGGIGNIGVGNTGLATVSGPSTINGSIDFSASNTGQFSNNNPSNVITGGENYNVSAVTTALNTVNTLNASLGSEPGASVTINGNTNVSASNGTTDVVGGVTYLVFDVTSFSLNNGQTLTINGTSSENVVFNFTSSTNFHGNVALSGGLTPDDVLFNFVGGSNLTGGPTLDLNNGGGSPSNSSYLSQGIFLDPNGPINITNSNVLGRVFGGDTHDFQDVSGSNVTAPLSGGGNNQGEVPEPGSMMLLGTALLGFAIIRRRRRV